MAEKIALVSDATSALGVTSSLPGNKCITVDELEEMMNSKRVCDIVYDILGSQYTDYTLQGLVAVNTSGISVQISANTSITVSPHSYHAWYFTSAISIEVGSSCYAIYLDPSYNLVRYKYINSHGNFSTKSGVIII